MGTVYVPGVEGALKLTEPLYVQEPVQYPVFTLTTVNPFALKKSELLPLPTSVILPRTVTISPGA
jgi:hypothetical protein